MADKFVDPWEGRETSKMKKFREAGDLAGLEKYKQQFIKSKLWHAGKTKKHSGSGCSITLDSDGGIGKPLAVPVVDSVYSKDIIGRYLVYVDKSGWRIHKVVKLDGNTITVVDVLGSKKRIHPELVKILGIYENMEDSVTIVKPVSFNIHNGPRLKVKKQKADLHKQVIKTLNVKRRKVRRNV